MPWVYDKPKVRKMDDVWEAALDHGAWEEWRHFHSWEGAMEHALWLGLNAGVWSM